MANDQNEWQIFVDWLVRLFVLIVHLIIFTGVHRLLTPMLNLFFPEHFAQYRQFLEWPARAAFSVAYLRLIAHECFIKPPTRQALFGMVLRGRSVFYRGWGFLISLAIALVALIRKGRKRFEDSSDK